MPGDFVAAARRYVGTPFVHQGRSPAGLDCLGLVIVAARDCGIELVDNLRYGRSPDYDEMRAGLYSQCARVKYAERSTGDLLWMRWNRRAYPMHLAICVDADVIVHADGQGTKSVCEHSLPSAWRHLIVSCLRFNPWHAQR